MRSMILCRIASGISEHLLTLPKSWNVRRREAPCPSDPSCSTTKNVHPLMTAVAIGKTKYHTSVRLFGPRLCISKPRMGHDYLHM